MSGDLRLIILQSRSAIGYVLEVRNHDSLFDWLHDSNSKLVGECNGKG
jgi:hypothetical protein